MQFNFKALGKDNKTVTGTLEAADRSAAINALTHQGLHPLVVTEAKASLSHLSFGKKLLIIILEVQ
jgi:type II secretory pathway component PulF